ncbi:MAG: phytanoyl-CoA dioxygenase family protein [Deferribacteres bacterium]|nr:phytanoyl-CoA dioxygenase family protein [candidate division KSB1 bacterium]MCB9509245.1 phytanoyl-CoA dioxygenase family protein [Deferribacteres bacterium]
MSTIQNFFQEQGFYHARGVFSGRELELMTVDFERIVAQIRTSGEAIDATWVGPEMEKRRQQGDVVLHTHNVQQYSAVWLRAMLQEQFLTIATELLGKDIILHHSKLFYKPAEKGSPFPMHQDWSYFPSEKDTMLAAIIHVSDATDEMGCLRVYPGSHKLGRLADSYGQIDSEVLAKYPLEGAQPVEAKAGDVVFFHYFTLHGSKPNRSPHIRKTVLVQMHGGEDRIEAGITHPNEQLVLSGWNHHMTRSRANVVK